MEFGLCGKKIINLIHYADSLPNYFHALFNLDAHKPKVLITGVHAPSVPAIHSSYWLDLTKDSPPKGTA